MATKRQQTMAKRDREQAVLEKRSLYFQNKARARQEQVRAREHEQRLKEWAKWRRGLSARKQLARIKGGLKQLVGSGQQ